MTCGGFWFVVLPDCGAASAVAERVRPLACRVVRHASGRPWLVGCWPEERATLAEAGGVRLAVLGEHALTVAQLAARADAMYGRADAENTVENAVSGCAGSFHLLASLDGQVYARGALSAARRLYHVVCDGVSVGADRARTLAWLTGARTDSRQLALRMASLVAPPYPLDSASVFTGVQAVPPEHALRLDRDGTARTSPWWRAPDTTVPLATGAAGLRQALRDAVAVRVRPGELWGADLSGGMDSTSVCFLAAEAGARLVTVTVDWNAPGHEDLRYAELAAARLPASTTRLTYPSGCLPRYLSGLEQRPDAWDEPRPLRDLAAQEHVTRELRAHGIGRRLSGQGGDQVVVPPVCHLHDMVALRPLRALSRLVGHRARRRWSRTATARALLDRGPLRRWLSVQADALARLPGTAGAEPDLGWGRSVRLPPWATPQARRTAADLLREAAEQALPLAPTRGLHAWAYQVRQAGRNVAPFAHLLGMPIASPFGDDAVIDACLRVRPHEASSPRRYKPLLVAAMQGVVPETVLRRTTKDGPTTEWHEGMKANRRLLAAWCDDSCLAATGLVTPDGLRRALLGPYTLSARHGPAVEATLTIETWLRDLAHHPRPAYLKEHSCESSSTP
ncbi:asparagine synthase [Streptomyces griseocarneus]|nr:asparagine synthase [Streptomyces griseocarneus]